MPSPARLPQINVQPYAAVSGDPAAMQALDEVFFSSSNTKAFASTAERERFRERWLGRYLLHHRDSCFVAIASRGELVGYICGSLSDPARDPLFADQPHFAHFAHVTPQYPAQLHVNLAEHARGQGIGGRLIEAYAAHAQAAGAPGVHAITSRGGRNIGFYAANGFGEAAAVMIGDKELVLLGRKLG